MSDLDLELERWAGDVRWPATPDAGAAVLTRIAAVPQPASRWSRRPRRRVVVAVVAALAAGGLTTVTPVGAKLGDLLGIAGGERVVRVPVVRPAARPLDLGRAVSLDVARRRLGPAFALPHALPPPDAVRLGGDLGADAVSLLYGRDTVLTIMPGVPVGLVMKQVGPRVPVRFAEIGGGPGFWIAGGARAIVLRGPSGAPLRRGVTVPGSGVLLWDRGPVGLRLETRRGLSAALRIARSVR